MAFPGSVTNSREQIKEAGGAPLPIATIDDQQVVFRNGYSLDGLTVASPLQISGGNTLGLSSVPLSNNARVAVNKNSGATVGTRRRINFIEGANVTLTIADDAVNEEVDVTIAASGGGGGGGTWTEAEVDFGSTPKYEASFTVTDGTVGGTSKIIVLPCGKAATGRTADDWQWDGVTLSATPGTGSFTLYAVALPGPVVGPRKIQYQVAS